MSFRKYLAELAHNKIQESQRYVIGNSSADYDSFFGSIIMAFFLTLSTGHFHTPLIDCKSQELKLRFEIVEVLRRLKIDSSSFRYRQQFHLALPHSIYNLYDHNVRKEYSNIQYVVDHHDLNSSNARKYLVDKMGSALTLLYYLINQNYFEIVAKQVGSNSTFVKKFEEFVKDEPLRVEKLENQLDFEIKEIIRNGILLDTFNLDVKQQDRWTIFDKLALQKLNSENGYQISFDELTDLKFDRQLNKNLTLSQSLTKDYKRFDYGGLIIDYSILYLHPRQFYNHYKHDLDVWFSQEKPQFHIYLLMSIFKDNDGQLRREMIFRVEKGYEKHLPLFEAFLVSQKLIKGENIAEWHYWKDPSVTVSRKKFDQDFRKYRGNHHGDL